MKVLSVLLVESSPLLRSALGAVLSRMGSSVTVCECEKPLTEVSRKYEVVLVDAATFPGTDEQLSQLVQIHMRFGPVLLLAREDRMDQIITGLKSGAIGLLKQTASERDLRLAINAVASGYTWFDRQIFQKLTRYLLPMAQWQEAGLTKREEEVLRCISLGQTNKEIASHLALSQQSVKVYVSKLLRKTGSPNRAGLALHAIAR